MRPQEQAKGPEHEPGLLRILGWSSISGIRVQGNRNVLDDLPDGPDMLGDPYFQSVRHGIREDGEEKTVFPDLVGFCGIMTELNFVISSNNSPACYVPQGNF